MSSAVEGLNELKELLLKEDDQGRQYYQETLFDDYTLARFLRARPGDVHASAKMFNDWRQWYKEQNVDEIRKKRSF